MVPLASPSRGSLFDCSSWGDATVGKISDIFEPADALIKSLGFSFEECLLLFDFDLDRVVTGHVFHQEAQHRQDDRKAQATKDVGNRLEGFRRHNKLHRPRWVGTPD